MSPAWLAGLDAGEDAEWIDSEQRGLVLRVRRRRMVWVRPLPLRGLGKALSHRSAQ
jgi:hypothetical protein